MDANLDIQLRVMAMGLEKLSAAQSQITALDNAAGKTAGGGMNKFAKTLESTGSRVNVLGQRLTFMAGVPLLAFGNNAIKVATEVEEHWTRFNKVFSGTEDQFNQLRDVSSRLSVDFARPVEEVADAILEFNKVGVTATDELEKLGTMTLKTANIFDMDMEDAFAGVRAVMLGFNLTAGETEQALADINMISDKTAASEKNILDMFQRSGGTARQYGVSIRELASYQSVLEKNNITGAVAGNAMKSVMQGMFTASDKAKGAMKQMGLDMQSNEFRTASFTEKLNMMAKVQQATFSSGNKMKIADWNEAVSLVFGKFQNSRANIVLEDLARNIDNNADSTSAWMEAMDLSADSAKNLAYAEEQLQTLQESETFKLAQLQQKYREQQIIIGKELLPVKMKLLEMLTSLLSWYNQLNPAMQDWIVKIGIAVVVLGPLLAAIGLMISSVGFAYQGITLMGTGVAKLTSLIGISSNAGLMASLSGFSLLLVGAFAAVAVVKAVEAFNSLQTAVRENKDALEAGRLKMEEYQQKIGTLRTDAANEQLANATQAYWDNYYAAVAVQERYEGWAGILNAVVDQFGDWGGQLGDVFTKLADKIEDANRKIEKTGLGKLFLKGISFTNIGKSLNAFVEANSSLPESGGYSGLSIVDLSGRGLAFANGGIVPGSYGQAKNATVHGSEMILNPSQQAEMFKQLNRGGGNGGG